MEDQLQNSEKANVARAAGLVGAATMLSRVFGLIRDMVITALFGAGWATDAFWLAFRIPNMLRRLLGEGSLTISFVPVFTEYLEKKSRQDALELVQNAFTLLSVILAFVSVIGIVISPVIVTLLAPGFIADPQKFELTVFLNRLMFPYIFFIALVALCMGVLNSLKHFTVPALSPVMLNLAMIGAALGLHRFFAQPITALAIGVLIGGVLQLAMQIPVLRKSGISFKFRLNLRHPGIRQIGRLMGPAILGAGVSTINVAIVGMILASLLPSGSVTYLFIADRIMELPLGVFAIAIGTATLPSFSRQAAGGQIDALKSSISFSLRLLLFLTIPASVALMALSQPIISVIFQRGAFDERAAILTAQALLCYAPGLCAHSVLRIFISSFYSLKDSKWPLKAAIVTLTVNVLVSLALMIPLKHNGIALALSISGVVNVGVLAVVLKNKIGTYLDQSFFVSIGKIIIASLIMLSAIGLIQYVMPWNIAAPFRERLAYLAVCIASGGLVFFIAAWFLKSPEISALTARIQARLARPNR